MVMNIPVSWACTELAQEVELLKAGNEAFQGKESTIQAQKYRQLLRRRESELVAWLVRNGHLRADDILKGVHFEGGFR
jgi:hypothetical protein